jgi:hypothetical protein
MPRLKCEIHGEATREYLACIHVMMGGPISLFVAGQRGERIPSRTSVNLAYQSLPGEPSLSMIVLTNSLISTGFVK